MQPRSITIPPTSPSYKDWNNAGLHRYDLPEEQKEDDMLLQPSAAVVRQKQSDPRYVEWAIRALSAHVASGCGQLIDGQKFSDGLPGQEIFAKYILPLFDYDIAKATAFIVAYARGVDHQRSYNLYRDQTSKIIYLITQRIGKHVYRTPTDYTIPGRIQKVYRWNPAETQFELDFYGASNYHIVEYVNNWGRNTDTLLRDVFHATLLECASVKQSKDAKYSDRDLAVYAELWKLQENHPELHDDESVSQTLTKTAANVLRNFSDESKAGEGYEPLFDINCISSEAMWLTLTPLAHAMTYPAFYEVKMLKNIRRKRSNDENKTLIIDLVEEIERCSNDMAVRDALLLAKICMQVFKINDDYRPRDQEAKDACIALAEQVKQCRNYGKLVTALLAFAGVVPTLASAPVATIVDDLPAPVLVTAPLMPQMSTNDKESDLASAPVTSIVDDVPTPVLAPAPAIRQATTSDSIAEARIGSSRSCVNVGKRRRQACPDESFNRASAEFYVCLDGIAASDLRIAPLLRLTRACQSADIIGLSPGVRSLVERQRPLLTQIYSQTARLIKEPTTQSHIDSYLALAESAKHCHEGKKLATAMLALVGAALLTSACLMGAGFALPLLTSNLIAQSAIAAVGVVALYKGLSLFKDAHTQHRVMKEVSEAMVPLVPALSAA